MLPNGSPATYEYSHPRPALTVDVVLFAGVAAERSVLLIRRGSEPFAGSWALPGGFVEEGERLEAAARRELAEETGIETSAPFVMVGAFGDPGRDPRGWTVSAVYGAVLGEEVLSPTAGDDAADARWFEVKALPELAFDHSDVIEAAYERLELWRETGGGCELARGPFAK